MELCDAKGRYTELCVELAIPRGITAVAGGGGKTSLLLRLASELGQTGNVVFTTSTYIYPPEGMPLYTGADEREIANALRESPVLCVGAPEPLGKLSSPAVSFGRLKALCDYVLVEADGSRGLPLKAHAPHEPAIPKEADRTLFVLGADGFYIPLAQAAHRPALMINALNGVADGSVNPAKPVDPAALGAVAARFFPGGTVIVNKAELDAGLSRTEAFARAYLAAGGGTVAALSLKGEKQGLYAVWRA